MTGVALMTSARPAMAGFQCGPGGKPKLRGSVGCDCPTGKVSKRSGDHWVCAATTPGGAAGPRHDTPAREASAASGNGALAGSVPPSPGIPVLEAPSAGAQDVDAATPFTVSSAGASELDRVEIELCNDKACDEIRRVTAAPWTGAAVTTRWPVLPAATRLFWRARSVKKGWSAGPYSEIRAFTTRADPAGAALSSDASNAMTTTTPSTAAGEKARSGESDPASATPDRSARATPDRSARVAAQARRADGEAAGAASPVSPYDDAGGRAADAPLGPALQSAVGPLAVPVRTAREDYSSRGYGIAAAAAGVVAVGIGFGFAWYGHSLSEQASRTGAMYDEGRDADGKQANRIATASLAAGAVLTATGAILYFHATLAPAQTAHVRRSRTVGSLALIPTASLLGVGLAVTGRLP